MKMVYTSENRFIVGNAKNILEAHGLRVCLKNEHASSAIGEISAFDAWVQLWVINDSDYEKACKILEDSVSGENEAPWICGHCDEENDASFEICWNCKNENS